jgi:G protein-coupled receptor 158
MLEGPILAKDLAVEYKYLANTSEWFYIARKNAERVIRNMTSLTKGKKFGSTQRAHFFLLFLLFRGRRRRRLFSIS